MEKTDFEKMIEKVQETVKSQPDELKMSKAICKDESASEVNRLTAVQRIDIAQKIIGNYSMLKKQNGILHD